MTSTNSNLSSKREILIAVTFALILILLGLAALNLLFNDCMLFIGCNAHFTQTNSTTTNSAAANTNTTKIGTTLSRTSQLIVNTVTMNGSTIKGYFNVFYGSGQRVANGFTPATFTLNDGENYTLQLQNYGSYVFDHWADTGSLNQTRIISISQNTAITAVYRNIFSPPPANHSEILVTTEFANGSLITGLYITIFQNGSQIQSGFSTYSFIVDNNEAYQINVADYGNYTFSHWSDGSTDRLASVTTGNDTTSDLVVVYT
jgi:hypothetical protein